MTDPSFELETAELRLAELVDEKSYLPGTLVSQRNERIRALADIHRSQKDDLKAKEAERIEAIKKEFFKLTTDLIARQTAERLELTRAINEQHNEIKGSLESKIDAVRTRIREAKKELTRQNKLAQRGLLQAYKQGKD